MVYYSVSSYNSIMFVVGILSWWYGSGWLQRMRLVKKRLASVADYFSIGLMFSTLFSPYRQISAGGGGGSLANQWQGFVDKTISRFVGAFIRTFMIIVGIAALVLSALLGVLTIIFWPLVPLLPAAGAILMVLGWMPL